MPKFTATLNVPQYSSTPSTAHNGDVYYNTSSNTFYAYINGTWTDLAAVGGGGGGGGSTIAESVRAAVRNVSGATIAKGTIVMLSGVNGQKPTIVKAIATGDSTSAATFGWVENAIDHNTDGYVTTFGILNNVDTQGWSDGDYLWLSGTTAGAATNVKTYAPKHNVTVGFVVKGGSAGAGQVFVLIKNGFELDEIHDVATHDYPPTDGQSLTWDNTNSLWKPASRVVSVSGTGAISSTGGTTPEISIADATTSVKGAVQLSDSTSTTSSTLAATATAAKAAYDRGSLGVTNAATAQSTADGKVASVSGTGAISSTGGTTPTISVADATTLDKGVVTLGSTNPAALGTASAGSASTVSKSDHVHPTTGLLALTTSTPSDLAATAAVGTETTAAKSDHVHSTNGLLALTSSAPANLATNAAVGTGTTAAKSDHVHSTSGLATVGSTVAVALGTASAGTSAEASRVDHVHPTTGIAALTSSAPANLAYSAAVGSGTTAAKSDHVHSTSGLGIVYYRTTDPSFSVVNGGLGITPSVGDVWVDSDADAQQVPTTEQVYITFLTMGA